MLFRENSLNDLYTSKGVQEDGDQQRRVCNHRLDSTLTASIRDLARFADRDTDFSVFTDPTEPYGNLRLDIASMLDGYRITPERMFRNESGTAGVW